MSDDTQPMTLAAAAHLRSRGAAPAPAFAPISGPTSALAFALTSALACLGPSAALADVWVFAPSVTLDQRFDDNYRLEPRDGDAVSATRLVGNLGLSRESEVFSVEGGVRADVLLSNDDEQEDELESNQLFYAELTRRNRRSNYGLGLDFKRDTPSRDIAGDLVGNEIATDSASVTQTSNVARRRFRIVPNASFALSRRSSVETRVTLTIVDHDEPNAQDAIYARYCQLNECGASDALSYDEVTIDDTGVFSPSGELDDYREGKVDLGYRFKLSPVTQLSAYVAYSRYEADVEPDALAAIGENDFEVDGDERGIRRKPRRDSISTTTSFRLGYDRALSETLRLGVEAGLYHNTVDDNDRLRAGDRPTDASDLDTQQRFDERLGTLDSSSDGWLANVSLSKDTSRTAYSARFAVDVQPSSAGSQVKTNELVASVLHNLTQLSDVSFSARAYEPDRLGGSSTDRFARRYISLEPRYTYRFARDWTASASYRYRRQKARVDPGPAESNAVIFSLTYTPPSKIRDAQGRR